MGQGGLMSAINSNSGDRDLEAIHRAQRAHEPSMEEILASIRNIIADDPAEARAGQAAAAGSGAHAANRLFQGRRRAAGATPPDRPAPGRERADGRLAPAAGGRGRTRRRAPERDEGPLLSPEANEAAALSFGALSASLEVRSAELADELVREMLRPMLKQWLDENLPAIVERLVRAEIQRVARGRK